MTLYPSKKSTSATSSHSLPDSISIIRLIPPPHSVAHTYAGAPAQHTLGANGRGVATWSGYELGLNGPQAISICSAYK